MKHLVFIRQPVGKRAGRGIPCLLISKGTSPSAHCWELKSAFISSWNSKLSSCLVCLQLRHALQGRSQVNSHFDFLGFPGGSAGKEHACNAGDLGSIPGLGRCPGEGKSYPLQYSGLENSMDSIVHGVAKGQTWLNNFHFHFQISDSCQKKLCIKG